MLESAKKQGFSKKAVFATFVAIYECFNNKASFGTTRRDVLQLMALEGIKEDMLSKGATSGELAVFDEAITVFKNRLAAYRKKGEINEDGET